MLDVSGGVKKFEEKGEGGRMFSRNGGGPGILQGWQGVVVLKGWRGGLMFCKIGRGSGCFARLAGGPAGFEKLRGAGLFERLQRGHCVLRYADCAANLI